jgi:metal-responsive CopG/Arc/MetJ family transcriptional regulator
MSSKIIERRGRPKVDSERVDVRMERDLLDGLDKFVKLEESVETRADGVRYILRHWLRQYDLLGKEGG